MLVDILLIVLIIFIALVGIALVVTLVYIIQTLRNMKRIEQDFREGRLDVSRLVGLLPGAGFLGFRNLARIVAVALITRFLRRR